MCAYLQILYGLTFLVSFYAVFKSLVFNLHMFQLNSYRFDEETSWLKNNPKRLRAEIAVFILGFCPFIPLKSDAVVGISATVGFVFLIVMLFENRVRPQKKPLVYTPRVKRLTFTTLLLEAVLGFFSVYMLTTENGKYFSFLFLALCDSLVPVLILLANLINKPVELSINRHYTNDAKRMLADMPFLEIMGITGSYGKTSVKFYLYTILREWRDTLVTPASFNTPMGIVKTIRGDLRPTNQIFLCEMGAKWVGDIKELCDIVHPKDGIITALGEQHLESFGSRENIIKTKYELARALPADGRLYVNWDCETVRSNPPERAFIKYGLTSDCDYYATDISVSAAGTDFTVHFPDGTAESFHTRLFGTHSVINITGAVAAAHGYGMPVRLMKNAVAKIEAVQHRMQTIKQGDVTIIDDAFNSNPAGCRAALETLGSIEGEKILVTPGMVELGEREFELNREFGRQASAVCDKICIIGKPNRAALKQGATEGGFPESRLHVFDTLAECMAYIRSTPAQPGKKKIVLLENDLPDNY